MILLPLSLALGSLDPDTALNQWRYCLRESAATYAQMREGGQPQETVTSFAEARCWKARANAMLALEPTARAAFADQGVKSPPLDVVGVLITHMLDGERDKALRQS